MPGRYVHSTAWLPGLNGLERVPRLRARAPAPPLGTGQSDIAR